MESWAVWCLQGQKQLWMETDLGLRQTGDPDYYCLVQTYNSPHVLVNDTVSH